MSKILKIDAPKTDKILITREVICNYIESKTGEAITRAMFSNYLSIGLPAVVLFGKYHAHADAIESWFLNITRRQNLPAAVDDPSIE